MESTSVKTIKESLSILIGKELQTFTRTGSMGDLGFGEYVQKEVRGFDENKKIIIQNVNVPKYAVHIDCHFRLSCGNTIILSRGDIFQPSHSLEINEAFEYDSFNWDEQGKNRFDEISCKVIADKGSDFIVEKISINNLGDFKLHFINGFLLEICPDISGNEECWRFFKQKSEEHLVVSGRGIEIE